MDYQQIIDAIFRNDLNLPHTILHDRGTTKIYKVDTPVPLIVRISEGDTSSYDFKASLLEELAGQDDLTAKILYWEIREIGDTPYGIQVQSFIPGKPLENYPDKEQSIAINRSVYKMHQRLFAASTRLDTKTVPDIHEVIQQFIPLVGDCPIKTAATNLLARKRYLELISQAESCIIDGDLWYKNIHVEQTKSRIDARLVDIDPLIIGPKILQPAILFSSYYLLTDLTNNGNEPKLFGIDDLLTAWPEPLAKEDVLLMMQVFPIGVGLLKEFRFSQDPQTNPEDRRMALEPLEKCLQIILQISGMDIG